MDVATQVPHAAVRVYVMGKRGAEREPATPEDRAAMARLAAEGIRAGALGFSTSRTIAHKTLAGEHIADAARGRGGAGRDRPCGRRRRAPAGCR